MPDKHYVADVSIIGGGLAGITTAIELLDHDMQVVLIDKRPEEEFGGMANEAFGGMHLVGTPEQRWNRVKDNAELAYNDWLRAAEYNETDYWPKRWAEAYCHRSYEEIYCWLKSRGVRFFPVVHWVERGDFKPGNTVPRYHVVWGTGYSLTQTLIQQLADHPNRDKLTLLHDHEVKEFNYNDGTVTGCEGEYPSGCFDVSAGATVICAGGINGNLERVKQHWDTPTYGEVPQYLLNGSHPSASGDVHQQASSLGAKITHLGWMWNYAAGVHHPEPDYPKHGLSLIPPRSSLWVDCYGNRIGPDPMVTGFDTHRLCQRVCQLDHQYSWHIMNWKIAIKELAISGSHNNPAFRDKNLWRVLSNALLGDKDVVQYLIDGCSDVVIADNIDTLVERMNNLPHPDGLTTGQVKLENLQRDIAAYDYQVNSRPALRNDDQLRRIDQVRKWHGDRVRICKNQTIVDSKALPLIAIRCFLLSRKSMGGLQTDLNSRVLNTAGSPIPGLFAAGEAAGFGGGGIAGVRSLEGTFLSNCIFNGRIAAHSIVGKLPLEETIYEKDRRVVSTICP